jgi:hypothetical protein
MLVCHVQGVATSSYPALTMHSPCTHNTLTITVPHVQGFAVATCTFEPNLHSVARVILGWDRAAMYPIDIPLALDALRGSARGGGNVGETLGQLVERLLRYR